MRALEITIWMIMLLTAPSIFTAMGLFPSNMSTCGALECQAQQYVFSVANQTQLEQVDMTVNDPLKMGWNLLTFSLDFIVLAFFWLLYILSLVVLAGPALAEMFSLPEALSTYFTVGIWFMWMLAIVQIKRGGLSVDGYR